jgi:hypothetical protein
MIQGAEAWSALAFPVGCGRAQPALGLNPVKSAAWLVRSKERRHGRQLAVAVAMALCMWTSWRAEAAEQATIATSHEVSGCEMSLARFRSVHDDLQAHQAAEEMYIAQHCRPIPGGTKVTVITRTALALTTDAGKIVSFPDAVLIHVYSGDDHGLWVYPFDVEPLN